MDIQHCEFSGRLVMLGFGCIGQGVLPLLLRHIGMPAHQILIVSPEGSDTARAVELGVPCLGATLRPDNFRSVLGPRLAPGDFLLNLSVNVSSFSLVGWCQSIGVLYLDTCIEPWSGGYSDSEIPVAMRTNYALREAVLGLRTATGGPTAVLTHGANPGLVSHLLKQGLLNIAQHAGLGALRPDSRAAWAQLAAQLKVSVVHIAERDTQVGQVRKRPDEFVNTWSVEAFIDEGCQPAELGWGTHEKFFPSDGVRHSMGSGASIFLNRAGASTRVRTWTPLAGPILGFLITHAESISIADYLTLRERGAVRYRPTVHYAYHPCDDAVLSLHELQARNWKPQTQERVLKEEITSGVDELGVLLMGPATGAYWYGSQLSTQEARTLCPDNSATSLQVTAAVMAGVVWAIKNPARGLVEPDDMPFDEILELCRPYLGNLVGVHTHWTPLAQRSALFEEDLDTSDPWQFKNFRVV
jgi:homospermidine synthase